MNLFSLEKVSKRNKLRTNASFRVEVITGTDKKHDRADETKCFDHKHKKKTMNRLYKLNNINTGYSS